MEIIKKIQAFISYWYLRYLLVTEMYMVEPWEKAVIRILFKNINAALYLCTVSHFISYNWLPNVYRNFMSAQAYFSVSYIFLFDYGYIVWNLLLQYRSSTC